MFKSIETLEEAAATASGCNSRGFRGIVGGLVLFMRAGFQSKRWQRAQRIAARAIGQLASERCSQGAIFFTLRKYSGQANLKLPSGTLRKNKS